MGMREGEKRPYHTSRLKREIFWFATRFFIFFTSFCVCELCIPFYITWLGNRVNVWIKILVPK